MKNFFHFFKNFFNFFKNFFSTFLKTFFQLLKNFCNFYETFFKTFKKLLQTVYKTVFKTFFETFSKLLFELFQPCCVVIFALLLSINQSINELFHAPTTINYLHRKYNNNNNRGIWFGDTDHRDVTLSKCNHKLKSLRAMSAFIIHNHAGSVARNFS